MTEGTEAKVPFAIIQAGGRQYEVTKGKEILIDLVEPDGSGKVVFDQVLLVADGSSVKIGRPTLTNARVVGTSLGETKGPKLLTLKFRRRQDSQNRRGHRQRHLKVRIDEIEVAS